MVTIQQAFKTHLLEKIPRVGDIVTFRFERPPGHEYEAGQWFVITFAGTGAAPKEGGVYEHHFSYSGSPTQPWLEFTTRLRGSEFKNALDSLPLGAEVEWEGPYGAFTLPPQAKRVAFLTGGIGITCVRSILRWLSDAGMSAEATSAVGEGSAAPPPVEQVTLLFANRSEDAIPFREELVELEAALPPLRVVNVISQPGESWRGYRGHIDQEILDRELLEPGTWDYYISGPPSMGQDMKELLLAWGVSLDSIKQERFEGYE